MICASRRPPPTPPGWEWVVAGSGLPIVHAAPRGDPHADEEAPRWGADPGARPGQPSAPPAAAPDRACQQQRQAVSHCERPDPPVEGGRPRSRDGALLCPAQFPGAPESLAAHDLIGINSISSSKTRNKLLGVAAAARAAAVNLPSMYWSGLRLGVYPNKSELSAH